MNNPSQTAVDAYALRVTQHLTQAAEELPYDITERLRAARMQALDKRKRPAVQVVRRAESATLLVGSGGAATLGGGDDGRTWWRALVSAVPVAALLVGLVFVNMVQDQTVAAEIAEVDAALLTDDLPPAAYADPGFLQFLKTSSPGQ